eukprot:2066668-Rhodomonas_salina.1
MRSTSKLRTSAGMSATSESHTRRGPTFGIGRVKSVPPKSAMSAHSISMKCPSCECRTTPDGSVCRNAAHSASSSMFTLTNSVCRFVGGRGAPFGSFG